MGYLFALMLLLFFLERRARKQEVKDLSIDFARKIANLQGQIQNNENASKNSYRKLENYGSQLSDRINGLGMKHASLKRDVQLAGGFIKEE